MSITDVLGMDERKLQELLEDQGAIVITPAKGFKINWDKINTPEDFKKVLQVLCQSLFSPTLYIGSVELEDHLLKDYLDEVDS